MTNLGSAVVNT